MLTIGRYRIAFGRVCWFQTHVPTTVRRILWLFWIIREAKHDDIDKTQRFPLGTPMMHEGRKYHYYKAKKDIRVGGGMEEVEERRSNTMRAYEKLGISPDDYMMLYWDFPNERVMAIDHMGKESIVGDIYDIVTKDECVISYKIRRCQESANTS